MIKVAGCWEFGWNLPIVERDLYYYTCTEFGVDEVIMTPISGIRGRVKEMPSIRDVLEANSDLDVVFVDEGGETPLLDFVHPENVLYVLGKVGQSSFNSLGKGYSSVKVETPELKHLMWGHQAISIVLYDRFMKCR